jgi:hypothetical protein
MNIKEKTKFDVGDKVWAIVKGAIANQVCETCGGVMEKKYIVAEVEITLIYVIVEPKNKIKKNYQVHKKFVYSILGEKDLFETQEEAEKELTSRGEMK